MIVYGKNVFNQIKEDPQQIQEVYVLNNIKDQSVQIGRASCRERVWQLV